MLDSINIICYNEKQNLMFNLKSGWGVINMNRQTVKKVCLQNENYRSEKCLHINQIPATERDFHIFKSNSNMANKWLISPQSRKIFILS